MDADDHLYRYTSGTSAITRCIMASFLLRSILLCFLAYSLRQIQALSISESRSSLEERATNVTHSLDVSLCPGYTLSDLKNSKYGLTAKLTLAGTPCNAFGSDIADLTIQVTYETSTRRVLFLSLVCHAEGHF